MKPNIIALLLLLSAVSIAAFGQNPKVIRLKHRGNPLPLSYYHISSVVDARADTTNIGTMRAGLANKTVPANLEGGAANAFTAYIGRHTQQESTNDSIRLHINRLNISERSNGFTEKATLYYAYSFYKNEKKLTELTGNNYAEAGIDVSGYIGKLVSQSIESALSQFDVWWQENGKYYKDDYRPETKLHLSILTQSNNPDYIVYNKARPLEISDFKGVQDIKSPFVATTFSGMLSSFRLNASQTEAILTIDLTPFFDRSKSYVKAKGKNPKVLKHEQLHFDITLLKTYEYALMLLQKAIDPKTILDDLNTMQAQFDKELETIQARYDSETMHGIKEAQQQRWEADIANELEAKVLALRQAKIL